MLKNRSYNKYVKSVNIAIIELTHRCSCGVLHVTSCNEVIL